MDTHKLEDVIGICESHDSGVCLFRDEKLIFAVNEERLNREKMTRRYPLMSLGIIKSKKLRNPVACLSSRMTPSFFVRQLLSARPGFRHTSSFSYLLNLYIIYQVAARKTGIGSIEGIITWMHAKRMLEKKGIKPKKIIVHDHHESHAYSAYCLSGFKEALVVTADGMGDGLTFTVSIGKGRDLKAVYREAGFSSLNLYYLQLTEYLGYKDLKDAGKVTSLAAYGNPSRCLPHFKKIFCHNKKGGFIYSNLFLPSSKKTGIFNELKKFSREDIAAAGQKNFEDELCEAIRYWIKKTRLSSLCLAGGTFANVKLNQRLHELPEIKNIFIFPHMGDGGLAAGAALAYIKPTPEKLQNCYLGPGYSKTEIKTALEKARIAYKKAGNIEKETARLIFNGEIIARFNGRMEYGPRALGNRSLLFRPDKPELNNLLNKNLKRDSVMPFAPAILEEDAKKCLAHTEGAEHAARFMTITFGCTGWMKKACPGAVHVDGTARPQIVSEKDNKSFYAIIREFKTLSGLPCIINTSFNMHNEPIVCSPDDAIRSAAASRIRYLAIGDYLADLKALSS